ncbi:MAG: S8 family serine peptidase, partial [Planctomycetota bacterium]
GVAGVLADHAPSAQIDSVQVLGRNKRGQTSVVLCALEWALGEDAGRRRYDVVNCSFGTREERYILGYKRLVDRAFTCNVLLVAASNNLDFRTREYPGSFPSVISTDFAPELEPLQLVRRGGHLVEFAARGASVRVPWRNGEYRTVTGSSFAAPQVAALAARIRERRPDWNACQVKSALYALAGEG